MQWGTDMEPNAKLAYTKMTGREVQDVGFIMPDKTDAYGGSPDGLVSLDGLLETKCPKPETLIRCHAEGILPIQYKQQVQGLLMISGRAWLDFFVFHPGLTPFLLRVEPDLKYQDRLAQCLLLLLREIKMIESKVQKMEHELISTAATDDELEWDND